MTVCIATTITYPTPGGIPNYYRYLANNLIAQGHTVLVLTIDHSEEWGPDKTSIENERYQKVVLNKSYKGQREYYRSFFRPGGLAAPDWIAAGIAMRNWLLEHHAAYHIDLVETADYGGTGIFLCHQELPPLAVTGHSSLTQLAPYNFSGNDDHWYVIKQLEELSFAFCNGIIAHSPFNKTNLEAFTNKPVCFSRAPWMEPEIVSARSTEQGKNIVIGGLQMTKGAGILAAAAAMICQQQKNWKVQWVGGDTYTAPGGKKVSAYLQQTYPQLWNTHFEWIAEKNHEEALEEMAAAEIVIIPSVWDTFNYCAIEAAWLQKPLIMTAETGASYLFKDDPNCIIIPSSSPEAIAGVFMAKEKLDHWKASITSATKERLRTYFTPEAIINERMQVYQQIIANKKLHKPVPEESLAFLKDYTKSRRKLYFSLRKFAKNLLKGDN